jgi:hypothetical protein
VSGEILYVNHFERWLLAGATGLSAAMCAVGAADLIVRGKGVLGIVAGLIALWSAAMAARVWGRDTVALEDGAVVVRGTWRTLRIPLAGTTWGIIPTYVGIVPRSALAVVDRDGRGRDLSRQGVWSPRRGAQHGRLVALAAFLGERAQAVTPP